MLVQIAQFHPKIQYDFDSPIRLNNLNVDLDESITIFYFKLV